MNACATTHQTTVPSRGSWSATGSRRRTSAPRYLVRVRRALEWAVLLAVMAGIVATLITLALEDVPGDAPVRPVKVEQGDTLWGLALAHPVQGLTTAETAELIRRANGMPSPVIHPGQVIMVPEATSAVHVATNTR